MHAGITSRSERKRCQCSLNPGLDMTAEHNFTGSKADGWQEDADSTIEIIGRLGCTRQCRDVHAASARHQSVQDAGVRLRVDVGVEHYYSYMRF